MTSSPGTPEIVILTGAGISRESGLHTFRDADGIWAKVRIEDVATPEAFARDPARVHAFYNARRRQLHDPGIQPNAAHLALARLEQARPPGAVLVITQNVDDLHERAGTRSLLHMHGELRRVRCEHCGARHLWTDDLATTTPCPACARTGGMRPDIVWFGEMPVGLEQAYAALARCRLFVSIGTSGAVYPAANFVAEAREGGAHTLELNLEPSAQASHFHEHRHGPAATIVPAWVEQILASPSQNR
ncbi:MAG: NAD-dependent protein deacylase [Opitutaceae bacterium]|nr:NAD-dependent protein deacylase [Opitutaceae bacterium]